MLEIDQKILNEIQDMINAFVMGIRPGGRHWISKDTLYTPTTKGGLGIIRLEDFTKAIKCSWVKRYCIDKLDDHWADKLDKFFNVTHNTRHNVLKFGPERFNKLIAKKMPGLSSIFSSFKTLKQQFPTCPSTLDNSWLCQPVFYNKNFTRKAPNTKKRHLPNTHFLRITGHRTHPHTG